MDTALAQENYLTHRRGLASWLFSLDHKRIGVMYLCAILGAYLLGTIFALLVRTELPAPARTIIDADAYREFFILHGAVMIFLVIIPGIPATLGNFVLPLMLGAKNLAFPRLNLLSFYLYLIGAAFTLAAILSGGADTGWMCYTPHATATGSAAVRLFAGVFILGISSLFTGLNFIVTIHTLRPSGMGWFKLPLFLWTLYAASIVQVLAAPVLGITLLLLIVERACGMSIFDPALGGDPVLYQHLFWLYLHPAVFITILPALGVISELISVFSHKRIFGYRLIGYSTIAIAALSFLTWGQHMFVSGQSAAASMIFSALSFSVLIPAAIIVLSWLATLHQGSIDLRTPMLFALSFILSFGIGGLSGLFLSNLGTSQHLHGTSFVVAHFHYLLLGGVMTAFFAGLHYWWPKITGRMYSEHWGRFTAVLIFAGLNLTFFGQFVTGSQGLLQRRYDYAAQFAGAQVLSTIGAYVLAIGFVIMAAYLIHSLLKGKRAPANPWGGATHEWRCSSPPPPENFETPPPAGNVLPKPNKPMR